jgi:hypothetical protein
MTTKYANEKGGLGREPSVPSSKSKKQLLLELLALESDNLGDVGEEKKEPVSLEKSATPAEPEINDSINDNEGITKPKKQLTEKQKEALKRGQQKRDENRERMKAEKLKKEEEEKRILEEKLVKKAIAVKKKQIKKQMVLDEISDDEDKPIQKQGRETKVSPTTPSLPSAIPTAPIQPPKPKIIFV